MEKQLKISVGILLAHIIKVDHRDIEKSVPLFCEMMKQNFDCTQEEVSEFLYGLMDKEYDLDTHLDIINQALCEDRLSKFHVMEQLNHIIYSDKISPDDYKIFEKIKNKLFTC